MWILACLPFVLLLRPTEGKAIAAANVGNSQPLYKNASILEWIPPKHLFTQFSYYVSGFDRESRPIFVVDVGKWPIRQEIEKGPEHVIHLEKYTDQIFYRITHGAKIFSEKDAAVSDDSMVICDWEGFNLLQFIHGPTIQYLLGYFTKFQELQEHLAYGYFLNANAVSHNLFILARPILGSVMERIEVYGTQQRKWVPQLLRKIDKDQLPPHYGGKDGDYTPYARFEKGIV